MLRNYLKIALRNLNKYKTYSLINILGLSLGITCTILILLFVKDELSYDEHFENKDRIYRITREWKNTSGESSLHLARIAPPIAPLLKNDYPDLIEQITRVRADYNTLIKFDDNSSLVEDDFFWAEENFFEIFDHKFIYGDPANSLSEPNTAVLTESTSKKYFGDGDPVGKTFMYEGETPVKVTGVIEDLPSNTHFHFSALGSFKSLIPVFGKEFFTTNWGRNNYLTYVLLPENVNPEQLLQKFPPFLDKHLTARVLALGRELPERKPSEGTMLHLQKLTDIHLHSHLSSEVGTNGDIVNIYLFTGIAVFTLLIACINFMNLATARSAKRAREIGMRKVLGAVRKQLVYQFLGESFFITIVSLLISLLAVEAALKPFNSFIDKDLSFSFIGDPVIFFGLISLLVIVTLVAGSYPAFLLSGFKPTRALKSSDKIASGTSSLRKFLVVSQFTISTCLIICVGIVSEQIDFMKNKDLGFTKERIVLLPASGSMTSDINAFKSRVMQNPNVSNVSFSRLVPSNMLLNSWGARRVDGDNPGPVGFRLAVVEIDYDFFETYEMKLIAGRVQSQEFATDSAEAFVINEEAARRLEWWPPEEAVNRPLKYGNREGRVVGVVANNNFESLHNKISPQIYLIQHRVYNTSVKIAGTDIAGTLDYLKNIWQEYRPDYPFEYEFLDDRFDQLYKNEAKLGEVFSIFAILAVIIASLGLLGLASYTAEQKTKEIGIRKTLGASISSILFQFGNEFSRLIIIANIIAWPLAYIGMNYWLQTFAYSGGQSVIVFLLAGLLVAVICILTISYQAIKAAVINPINAIRYE